ncbi:MAG: alpha-ketoacid dehydrogenase subunit beta [Rhodospirillales bacterium]|nr:alpha-ketoacid dehydrogenase subunit beta [Rhodospirillales bacterium]
MRLRSFAEAIREGLEQALADDPRVCVMGPGVPGPTGIFGTTRGLAERFGPERVMDMPSSEQAMTGFALGATLDGYRPVIVHMRVDFAVLAMDQMVNQVAKWHFMYGGRLRAPMVFRLIVGRGWGQGPQHSQSLQAWFAHVPGFKVAMPASPRDAKGMLVAAIRDDSPVVLVEHRWLYGITGDVPEELYETKLGEARVARPGRHATVAATSHMVIEALRAAERLAPLGIEVEVVDMRSLVPLDADTLCASVARTGHLVVADTGTIAFGAGAEIAAVATERAFAHLKKAPVRIGLPHFPSPTTPALADAFYPRAVDIERAVAGLVGLDPARLPVEEPPHGPWRDTPDPSFKGPY